MTVKICMEKTARLAVLIVALLVGSACRWTLAAVPTSTPTPSPTREPISSPTLKPTTAIPSGDRVPAPFETDTPTTAPTPTAPPTPPVDFGDLSPFQKAMVPAAQRDVTSLAGLTRYYIDVTIDPSTLDGGQSPGLKGVERLLYTNTETVPLTALYLRLFPNTPGFGGGMMVSEVILNERPVSTTLESQGSALRVPLEPPLLPGEHLDLTLRFRAHVPPNLDFGYGIYSYYQGVLALADFYPLIPVYDAQGWHIETAPPLGDAVYSDTALYLVRATAPRQMVVVTSGSILERRDNGDGSTTWTAASGPMRDFYLVMAANFQKVSGQVGQTTINSYYLPGHEAGGRRVLEYASKAFAVYSQDFGSYPYSELDVAQTPTTAGGIEYPGAVVIASGLYDQVGGFAEHATAHEVAHQWWYGLVGSDQVNIPWLDEALTNYSVALYWEETLGKAGADEIVTQFYEKPYQAEVAAGRDRPVDGPTSSFDQGSYSAIVYTKGPLFFRALRQRVGDETYMRIMQTYLQRYKYKIATPADFLAVAEEVSGQSVNDLYQKWILGAESP
jgi:hypothetical protein